MSAHHIKGLESCFCVQIEKTFLRYGLSSGVITAGQSTSLDIY